MARTTTVDKADVKDIRIAIDESGSVTGLEIQLEVSYGAFIRNEPFDMFPDLTDGQKAHLQAVVDKIQQKVAKDYLA